MVFHCPLKERNSLLHETGLSFKTAVVKGMKILTHRICNSVVFLEDKATRYLISSFLSLRALLNDTDDKTDLNE